jgi:hypothetical protein
MAKQPKNKFASSTPFSLAVCNRIRWCIGQKAEAVSARKTAFENRDSLRSELAEVMKRRLQNQASETDLLEAKAGAFDAEREIESLELAIKFYNNTITETVQKADTPELDGMMDEMPLPLAAPEPKPKAPAKPRVEGPAHAEGVNEHLDAAVAELDLPELQKGRLVKGGFETIGALAKFVDEKGNIRDRLEIGENQAGQILKALAAFRSRHRSAIVQVEREAVGA